MTISSESFHCGHEMITDKQFIFIVGSPRSGTTWLQMMLGAHPLVCTTAELTLFTKYTASWISAWERETAINARGLYRIGLPVLWSSDDFYGFLREFLERAYARVTVTKPQATHILDKHPPYSDVVEQIDMLLPNSLFVHVIRDGRDVAVSMVAARQSMGFGPKNICEAATRWKRGIQGARVASKYRNRYLELRYEDMLKDGIKALKSVFKFCDLTCNHEDICRIVEGHRFDRMKAGSVTPGTKVEAMQSSLRKGKSGNWKEELRPIEKYLFDKYAGALLSELGYAERGWWWKSRHEKYVLPLLSIIQRRRSRVSLLG
jgi:hypothetical protein